MRLTEIITPQSIRTGWKPPKGGKAAIIRDLVGVLCQARGLDPEQREALEEAILAREAQKSTGIGKGVAVPHGKSDKVAGVCGVLAIADTGVEFAAADKQPVRYFVLMASDFHTSAEHVAALAQITRVLQRADVAKTLAGPATPAEVHALLRKHEKTPVA